MLASKNHRYKSGIDPFKEKFFVFFISGGRTGTKFFADVLSNYINDSFSIHEPDVIHLSKGETSLYYSIKAFGIYWVVIGKLLGKTGIRNLSERYLSGKCTIEDIKETLYKYRKKFYHNIAQQLIIESYSGWYALIPGIRETYSNYKIIIIIRDPRDWVSSNMNWGTMYGNRDWVQKLGLGRLSPELITDKEYTYRWKDFDQFQKLCWAWRAIYETLLEHSKNDPNIRIFKFEDLFCSKGKEDHFSSLLRFITTFNNQNFYLKNQMNKKSVFNKKIHENISYDFPLWKNWSKEYANHLNQICGFLMSKFEYGSEPDWKCKINHQP